MKSGARTPVMFGLWQWFLVFVILGLMAAKECYLTWKTKRRAKS